MDLDGVDFGSHGIIYVTQEKEKPTLTEWTNPATEELLKILKKHYKLHENDGKFGSKRAMYENCSIIMKKRGFRYTASQCENKWKSLKRRYLTMVNRCRATKGKKRVPFKRQLFDDEIEFLLQYEKPAFKKEPEDPLEDTRSNTNLRSDFDEEMDQDEENNESDENDQKYTQNDEQLVHMMLKGSDDEDNKLGVVPENIQFLYEKPKQKEDTAETTTTNNLLINEVRDLAKAIKCNADANTNLLKSHTTSYEQILVSLDSLDRKADEQIEIQKKKLEKQAEFLQQKKIHNSLLAKIVQKMGNMGGSGTSGSK